MIALDLNVAYSVLRIVDLILRIALVGFSLLRLRCYCNRKVIVCYIYLFYSPYSYGKLSIYVSFMLLRDAPAYVHLILLYFNLQQTRHFIMFYL